MDLTDKNNRRPIQIRELGENTLYQKFFFYVFQQASRVNFCARKIWKRITENKNRRKKMEPFHFVR